MHAEKSQLAGRTVHIRKDVVHPQVRIGGQEFHVEDWWDRLTGGSWMDARSNPACIIYAIRSGFAGLPMDDEVLYGKVGPFGHLIHISEIELPDEGGV